MTVLKQVTVGIALLATTLAVSVAQADNGRRGDRFRDVVDTIDRLDRIGRGGLRGELRMNRLTSRLVQDLQSLKQIVRLESRSKGVRGPARRAISDIEYVLQSARQMRRVVRNRGLVPRLVGLHRQARADGRQMVMSVNRVNFVSRYGERQASRTIDDIRMTMQTIKRVLENNNVGRGGRGGRGGHGGRRGRG